MILETRDETIGESDAAESERLDSLTRLAGGLSHDINNYLTGILGNATMALRKLEADSPCRGLVQEIERAALHAAALTERMLTFAGRVELTIESVKLGAMIRQMERLVKLAVPGGAELVLELDPDLPVVRGDAGKLRDLVMQLVLNAGEALGSAGGEVRLSTETRLVDAVERPPDGGLLPPGVVLAAGEYVVLRVSDDGNGMDAETRRHAYEPFFSSGRRGRGLGLAEVLGIVMAHNGAIRFESAEERGTVVEVFLPTAGSDLDGMTTAPMPVPEITNDDEDGEGDDPLANATVLVVDDEEIVRTLATSILEDTDCRVLTAGDGLEALVLAECEEPPIDVVVLDLSMPGMDGAETFCRLREIRPELPILLSSGHRPDDIVARLGTEPTGFIRKPYRPSDLIDALESALREPGEEA